VSLRWTRKITLESEAPIVDDKAVQDLQAGYRLQQQGDLDRAVEFYLGVLRRFPENEFALNLMGVVCVRRGDYPAAVDFLKRALAVNERDAETHNNLGLAYEATRDLEGARRAFERSLSLQPRQPVVLNNLGNVLSALNRHREAIERYQAALVLDPKYVDCLGNLALSFMAEHQNDLALRVVDRALALAPERASLHSAKGRVLLALTRYAEAQRCFETAITLDPELLDARIQLSTAQKQLHQGGLARRTLEYVLGVDPNNSEAHKCLGVLLEQSGDFTGAARHFREAIAASPRHASAYYQLSKLSNERLTTAEYGEVQKLLDDPSTPGQMRGPLLFALACELEKQGDYASSLERFSQGNQARSTDVYEPAADDAYYKSVTATFPLQTAAVATSSDEPSFVPIFVLGMPRSGTTLTEQILASHSEIKGAGELGLLSGLALEASSLTRTPFPQCCRVLTEQQVRALQARYRTGIEAVAGSGRMFVDKTPMNFQLIGFIARVLPQAKIIYCKRHPLDNCLSIFKLPFDETQQYSHDLQSLGRYYQNHERLMAYWHECFPDRILTIHYEETVADVSRQAHRLLEFVGVDFEDQVLEFYRTERIVLTPSAQQVRRPIYSSSVDVWRKYGDGLRPLMAALGISRADESA
jgi:tetratricopeptide (TPR) repeat protein